MIGKHCRVNFSHALRRPCGSAALVSAVFGISGGETDEDAGSLAARALWYRSMGSFGAAAQFARRRASCVRVLPVRRSRPADGPHHRSANAAGRCRTVAAVTVAAAAGCAAESTREVERSGERSDHRSQRCAGASDEFERAGALRNGRPTEAAPSHRWRRTPAAPRAPGRRLASSAKAPEAEVAGRPTPGRSRGSPGYRGRPACGRGCREPRHRASPSSLRGTRAC